MSGVCVVSTADRYDTTSQSLSFSLSLLGPKPFRSRYLSEFTGTFLLVFTVGCNVLSANAVWAATSIACVLMVSIYALGGVSGAHFNPAVTVTLQLAGKTTDSCRSLDKVTGLAGKACAVQGALNCTIPSPTNLANPSKHRQEKSLLAVRERWYWYRRHCSSYNFMSRTVSVVPVPSLPCSQELLFGTWSDG